MNKSDVKKQYWEILKEKGMAGNTGEDAASKEQRGHPRLKVGSPDFWLNAEAQLSVIDLSASGVSFVSNHPLKDGEHINLSLANILNIDTEVVRCQLVESATEFLDAQFRIHCRFLEETEGMELVIRSVHPI